MAPSLNIQILNFGEGFLNGLGFRFLHDQGGNDRGRLGNELAFRCDAHTY